MVFKRQDGSIHHRAFRDLPEFLSPGDVLVINETRVIPARLHVHKAQTGGKGELLLIKRLGSQTWEALVGGSGMAVGVELVVRRGMVATIVEELEGSRRIVRFNRALTPLLDQLGEMPLPPYIHTPLQAPDDYQTIFAHHAGSAAAPTAGLHFTVDVFHRLRSKGVSAAKITLHIGLDTFLPVTEADPLEHTIHREWCRVPEKAADLVNSAAAAGHRVVAVGTTTVRTLESAARVAENNQRVGVFEGETDLFILPGFRFRAVDALITNFHLPCSTLLMLVSAFMGRTRALESYEVAKHTGYRFYSFGDAMLIL
jgi:S-adenosylmethionine:tRNA ribosyltransferase-isomerase